MSFNSLLTLAKCFIFQVIASMSGACVNLILIMSLGRVYEKLAFRLTTWGKSNKISKGIGKEIPEQKRPEGGMLPKKNNYFFMMLPGDGHRQ